MFAKFIVITVFILIIGSLGSALIHLLKNKDGDHNTVRALTWRIGLSIALFIGLMIAGQLGLIKPHSIQEGLAVPLNAKP